PAFPYTTLFRSKAARGVLPEMYSKQDAVDQNAISNALVMAICAKDFSSMGRLMMKDRLHEPSRRELIREYGPVRQASLEAGAYATVISGAGPTLMTVCDRTESEKLLEALRSVPKCIHDRIRLYKKV